MNRSLTRAKPVTKAFLRESSQSELVRERLWRTHTMKQQHNPAIILQRRLALALTLPEKQKVRITEEIFGAHCADAPEEFNPLGENYTVSSIDKALRELCEFVEEQYNWNINPIVHLREYFPDFTWTCITQGLINVSASETGVDPCSISWWRDIRDISKEKPTFVIELLDEGSVLAIIGDRKKKTASEKCYLFATDGINRVKIKYCGEMLFDFRTAEYTIFSRV